MPCIMGLWVFGTGVALAAPPAATACTGMMSRELPRAECDAWQAIYDGMGGPDWHDCAEYRENPCLCTRVHCHDGVSIRKLLLHRNNLVSSIPAAIGAFPRLEVLGLMENQLIGMLPAALGDLSWLEMLFIGDNALTGPIPPSFGGLTSLVTMYVGNNALDGSLPPSLGQLTDLTGLYLSNNSFHGALPAGMDWEQFEECGSDRCCTLGGTSQTLQPQHAAGNRWACPLPAGALKYCSINATDCVGDAVAVDGGSGNDKRDEL